ncbi:Eco57I restriction-modification methylase domain-containing protein [Brachybacterium sp. AOP42-E1-35]|uniref:Eco57I restriction-modification methylase domain-containing protein n=1 Tax=Brachybacterium sp. AOP42-E1-35 TaxID=3457664 RepID=UPI00402A71EF
MESEPPPDPGRYTQSVELPKEQAQRQLQSALDEPHVLAATERIANFHKARESTAVAGYTNSGLFATYHLTQNVPQRPDWDGLNQTGAGLLNARGRNLIEALGFKTSPASGGAVLLSTATDASRAVAVLLDDAEQFDNKSPRFQLSPVAYGLAVATQQEVPWLMVLRKDQIRLYPGRDGVGVGSKGQAETYFEIDLSAVDASYAGLLPLIFTADALAADGTTDQLLDESTRYATELGERLRERIYDEIIPPLAVEVAYQLAKHTRLRFDAEGLDIAYRVTLRILFRLLFQAYAEDRGLLPSGRNEGFDAKSLKTNAQRLIAMEDDDFGEAATLWRDLTQVWDAIDKGNAQWQIPAYNGGLFSSDPARSPDGALFTKIQIPDRALGPALTHLLIDTTSDGVDGPVDFRSLSVREFGTIYEGLLESSLSKAEQDLTLDRNGAWVPAQTGDDVHAPAGAVYFHTASGERKATGSYFTPKVVVDHLIDRSLVPKLTAHLDQIEDLLTRGDAAAATREFFNFRVADLAMGSGHFLIAAVDKIEALMRTFLTEHAVPGVTDELLRLASAAKDALGSDTVAKSEVDEIGLLRRQVARRCIYGLDINPMAVELSRLALWIHTFVPGLPMSNLDHGLVNANSLTGIGTIEEALDVLQPDRAPGQGSFFDDVITGNLASAKTLLSDLADAGEADKSEVEESARILEEARNAAAPAKQIFDVAVAARVRAIQPGLIFTEAAVRELADQPQVTETIERLRPAHMPVLFPEVFLRTNPGFDVLLGNPPWEKLHVEEHQWWGLRLPGLRAQPAKQRTSTLEAFRTQRPDLEAEYQAEILQVRMMADAVSSGPYVGLGAAHLDLYQAFAWRNWQLLRNNARLGLVLPRGAHSGSGLARWRSTILEEGTVESVVFLANNGGWIFDTVHNSYTIGLTVASRGGAGVVRWTGPFLNERDFRTGAGDLAEVPASEFLSWSRTAAFPLIPDPVSAEVFRLMKRSPRFDEAREGWEFRPLQGDMNASGEKRFMEFDTEAQKDRIAVLAGATYNLWNPDAGAPFAYSKVDVLRPHLAKKLAGAVKNSRSAYQGLAFTEDALPMDSARIAFRDITRSTDTRTVIACLIPPGSATVHQSPILVRRRGDERAEAFLLGVMASIPFDWGARRWVELHLTFEVLNALPVPVYDPSSEAVQRVAKVSGRLAAVDQRYAQWAAEVGVPVGSVKSEGERDELVAELDALVSLLFGLTEDHVEHVFATFHRGWNYEARLEKVLKHYARWKGQS